VLQELHRRKADRWTNKIHQAGDEESDTPFHHAPGSIEIAAVVLEQNFRKQGTKSQPSGRNPSAQGAFPGEKGSHEAGGSMSATGLEVYDKSCTQPMLGSPGAFTRLCSQPDWHDHAKLWGLG